MKLDDRMKQYEYVTRTYLPNRLPVIIRIDGKAFHTFSKGFKKPFDGFLSCAMTSTTKKLVENVEGCVFGYTQSDEISLLLKNDQTNETSPWFDNNISKLISLSASMATLYFNDSFRKTIEDWVANEGVPYKDAARYWTAIDKGALFDSRAFVLPNVEEVVNYFLYRQQDCTKNSIQSVAQANFSHKEIQGLNCDQLQEKLFQERKINWGEDTPTKYKRGIGVYKSRVEVETPNGKAIRTKPIIDKELPIFSQDRDFIKNIYLTGVKE